MGDNSSIFGPASSSAEAIMDLFTLLIVFSAVILAIVLGVSIPWMPFLLGAFSIYALAVAVWLVLENRSPQSTLRKI